MFAWALRLWQERSADDGRSWVWSDVESALHQLCQRASTEPDPQDWLKRFRDECVRLSARARVGSEAAVYDQPWTPTVWTGKLMIRVVERMQRAERAQKEAQRRADARPKPLAPVEPAKGGRERLPPELRERMDGLANASG